MHTTRPALATTALLVEAESFDNHGGWTLDSQVEREMGSTYLLAQVPGPSVTERGWRSGPRWIRHHWSPLASADHAQVLRGLMHWRRGLFRPYRTEASFCVSFYTDESEF